MTLATTDGLAVTVVEGEEGATVFVDDVFVDDAVVEDGAPVVVPLADLPAGVSSPHDADTAAPDMKAAPRAYCAARESPAPTGVRADVRTSPSQNGHRASVSWT